MKVTVIFMYFRINLWKAYRIIANWLFAIIAAVDVES